MGQKVSEPVMNFTEAACWFKGRFGRQPNVATIWRWAVKGCRGVRLQTISLGRYRYTTEGALERFIDEMSAASIETNVSAPALGQAAAEQHPNSFTDKELAAARRRREAEKTKAKEFLRQNLGSKRGNKKISG